WQVWAVVHGLVNHCSDEGCGTLGWCFALVRAPRCSAGTTLRFLLHHSLTVTCRFDLRPTLLPSQFLTHSEPNLSESRGFLRAPSSACLRSNNSSRNSGKRPPLGHR